ncbi:MAG TPA: glutaredoxin family protein [Tepidiformaceae bacterium]|nr:glutaredoxin family protein [Tepidiformaceae bacterium]HMO94527.1 glutaredoxin family protein [Tepidiformaceae bacterium]
MQPIQVTLYGRRECGLCDHALAALQRIATKVPLDLTVVDIDTDEELQARYFIEIPVVVANGEEVARAPISERTLAECLEALARG